MNKNKKIVATVAVLAASLLTVSGCTKKNDVAEPDASTSSSSGVTVAFVPKLQGIPYFEAMNTGGAQAAEDLGFTWLYQGPTTADAAAQADIVRSFIQQDVSAIIVAPNDPDSLAPVLDEAAAKGIAVLTADTDAAGSDREVFVSQASADGIGRALTDQLLTQMGGRGSYAIVSCGETAENLNSWIDVQRSYTAEKYPDAKLVDVVYAGEDQAKAAAMATDLMNAHPDLTGLVGECTTSAPGVAQAVKDANKTGTVSTVGVGTPKSMLPYLTDGSSGASVLWDVQNLGYLSAWAGARVAQGEDFAASNDVREGLDGVTFDPKTHVLLMGDPLVLTAENAGKYDY